MRDAESAALGAALATEPPAIVGVAAGVVMDPLDRARLAAGGLVVWLNAPAEVLASRSAAGHHRPWMDGDALGWFRRALEERTALYAEIADVEIDTSVTPPEEAADAILRSLPSAA